MNESTSTAFELREISELTSLMRWRTEVLEHVFGQTTDKHLLDSNRRYYLRHINDGSHIAIVATVDGTDCGCGSVCFSEELPSPDNPAGNCAYLMNIYVREPFRNKGIAHRIVSHLIDKAKDRGCEKIYLETTSDGKPVYTSLGFREMPDMMKYYDTEN